MESVKEKNRKNISIILAEDIIQDEGLKFKIQQIDGKARKTVLLATLCAIWSYAAFALVIFRVYDSFNGKHLLLLSGSMILLSAIMGVLIYLVWKGPGFKSSYSYFGSKTYLKYQISKLSGQRKLIALYLIEYTLLLITAIIFFYIDIPVHLGFLLKLTLPIGILTYVLGASVLADFSKQIKDIELVHKQINLLYTKKLAQN